ncbi:MAG: PotD/PotF family extracellular solute-binding protein [Novosphingobium sp.]
MVRAPLLAELTRRRALQGLGTAALAVSLGSLTACGESEDLNFANWESYLGETTLDDFREATGIDVSLSIISSEDELFKQLRTGTSVPDLLVASNRMVERLVDAHLLAPISHARIPNLRNIDPRFADPLYDKGLTWSVPYTWQVYGIGYRRSKVPAPPKGWQDLFDNPAFAGRFALPSDAPELFGIVARTLGKGPDAIDEEDVPILAKLLETQLPRVKAFHNDDGQDLLLNKTVDLVAEFNGDIAQVMLEDDDLGFVMPIEGSELTCDGLCIPAHADRPGNAHRFIDYLLQSQAGMRVLHTILYPTPNLAAKALMPLDYQTSGVLFPPADLIAKSRFARWNPPLDAAIKAAAQPLTSRGTVPDTPPSAS